ncbi:MAG: HTTM domain-containing protein [Rhodospirillales bacterium]|nr:HTTM domain-containing protein [Rhodospirillales bacterium]
MRISQTPSSSLASEPARLRIGAGIDWRAIISVDARSLALCRIVLAAAMLIDLWHVAMNFTALYSDQGVLPRAALLTIWRPGVENSLYLATGSLLIGRLLLLVQFVVLFALLIGYRSRTSAFLALMFTISLQARNFMTNQASDDLARLLLVWMILAPVGARASVDAALNRVRVPDRVLSVAALGIQIQAMCVYTFGALLKFQGVAWPAGHAVARALADGTYGSVLGRYLLPFPELLTALTYFVETLELLMPLLIWFPIGNFAIRSGALLLLFGMHTGFLLLLHVGIFPIVSFASLTLFITTRHWEMAGRLWRPAARCTHLFYDRDCGFCVKTCLLLRAFCLPHDVAIQPAQSDRTAGPLLVAHNSWVVRDESGAMHLGWDAVCFVFRQSPIFWMIGWLGQRRFLRGMGRALYAAIGRNRGTLGQLSARFLPYHGDSGAAQPWSEWLGVVLIGIILTYNVAMLNIGAGIAPPWFRDFVIDTRLEQKWAMFAPEPQSRTEWIVVRGESATGTIYPISLRGRRLAVEPHPVDGEFHYPDTRWKKYFERLLDPTYATLRPYYGAWLCRMANRGQPADARILRLSVIDFVTHPFAPHPPPRQGNLVLLQSCP